MPKEGHPLYVAWLRMFDRMIDAEESWAMAKIQHAPNEYALRRERDEAREAYFTLAERL
jgi:hypothetical protein